MSEPTSPSLNPRDPFPAFIGSKKQTDVCLCYVQHWLMKAFDYAHIEDTAYLCGDIGKMLVQLQELFTKLDIDRRLQNDRAQLHAAVEGVAEWLGAQSGSGE